MRLVWIFSLILVASLCMFGCGESYMTPVVKEKVRKDALDFTLPDTQGGSVTLSSHKGQRAVLLVFWATWCPSCREEIPYLNALRREISQEKLAIYGIDVDESLEVAKSFKENVRMEYDVLVDHNAEVALRYGLVGVPTLFLISKEGEIVAKTHGLSRALEDMIREEAQK